LRERAPALIALGGALVLAYLAVRPELYVSWTPSDEGVLAQGAERVLHGELPHRDFIALWSGGLDWLNASAFALLGPTLGTLRTVVAAAWLLALAAFFAASRHLLSAPVAGALTVCVALWTLPLSPHPLPTWYNLFLALGGVLAVLQWRASRKRRWLVVAGAAAAASVAVKIVGLYFAAAVLLYFVWQVQEAPPAVPGARPQRRVHGWLVTGGLLAYLAMVAALVRGDLTVNSTLHFIAPNLLLAGALLWREWRLPADGDRARLAALAALAGPFAAGAGIVLCAWLWPYLHAHALAELARGLFVTPRVRLQVATYPLPGLRSAGLAVMPFAVLLAGAPLARQPLRRVDHIALFAVAGAALACTYDGSPMVLVTWYGLRLLTPVCTALALWWLLAPPRGMAIPEQRRATLFFLVAAAATGSLVQIPFALYTYFLYFAPLLALALAALVTSQPAMPRAVPGALLAFVLLFAVRGAGSLPKRRDTRPQDALASLALPRGGIIVTREDSSTYATLVAAIRRHASGEWMYVWHDAPQLYFLAAMKNPTRTLFEVFDDSLARSPTELRRTLREHDVRLVVLTDPAGASRPLDPAFREWLLGTYPESETVERFEVRWRRDGVGVP